VCFVTTFTLTGFSVTYDGAGNPIAAGATATLAATFPNDTAVLNYSVLATPPDDLPEVDLGGTDPLGASINGSAIGENSKEYLGAVTTSEGTHVVLVFEDPDTDMDFIFRIGGDPLTLPTSLAAFEQLDTAILDQGTATGAFAPDQDISFSGLAGVTSTENDTIRVDNTEFFRVEGGLGDDSIDMSGLSPGDGYAVLDYAALSGPIDVGIDGAANTGTIDKGTLGTDTLIGVEIPLSAGWTLGGLEVFGTSGDDTFDVSPDGQQWMSIRPGDGADTLDINGSGLVRLDFRDAAQGIEVDLASRVITNDGFGNAETIQGTSAVWEVYGSGGDDLFIGSGDSDSYRYNGGDNDLDGGAGFDRLRYDSSGVNFVIIDAELGFATGTLDGGGTFLDTISGFERLRGSSGDDVIIGEAGVDNRYEGQGGRDTFVHLGGTDTIGDFDPTSETLVVSVAGLDQTQVDAAVAGATDVGGDARVDFAAGSVLFTGLSASDLAGADVQFLEPGAQNLVQGTDGNDTLQGTSGDDLVLTGDADVNGDLYIASAGDDTIDMSGMNQTDAWFVMNYEGIAQPIDILIDGSANTGTIGKGMLGTDTLVNVENPLLAGWISGGLSITGTERDDTFDVSPAGPQWMNIRPGDGVDTIIINGDSPEREAIFDEIGAVRLDMRDGDGIDVNLETGVIADDGFGNTEQITGNAPLLEVYGSQGDDIFVGSDNADSYRYRGGDNDLDGGAGFDRLRYDTFGVASVTIDAAAGTATGPRQGGGTFTDTISGFEHLRGSNGEDQIIGEAGVDNLYEGRAGNDTFVHLGGTDTIGDFDATTETLVVRVAGLDQAQVDAAVAGATDVDGGARVDFATSSVLFTGLTASDLAAADVQFLEPGSALPPPPPPTLAAWTVGDPHLLTLDGIGYDFHAVGEYVLLRGQSGADVGGFEIQSRMTPALDDQGVPLDNVSINAAIAMRAANGDAVMIDSTDASPLSVNGIARSLSDGDTLDVGADRIYRDGDTYTMVFAGTDGTLGDGDTQVSVVVHDTRVDLGARVSDTLAGRLEGLLGDGDGDPANDIARADGTVLERPLAFEDLYGVYRDDWRVDTEGDSLFTYDAGETLAGFYDPAKPGSLTTIDDFDPADLASAQQAADAAGLTPGTLNYDNAVLDFLLTNDEGFIDSAASEDLAAPETASAAPTLDVGQARATLDITVTDRDGNDVEGASVGFSAGGVTARSLAQDLGGGAYGLSVGEGASGRVDGSLAFSNTGEITAGDALEVLRIAVGLDPSWGPAQGLDFVAADVNRSGSVTAGDALEVLRNAVGLDSESAPEWIFVDPDQDVSGATETAVPAAGGVDIAAISGTQSVAMTAVLLGNMEDFA
jgi:hypothetical protein